MNLISVILLAISITITNGRFGVGPCPKNHPKLVDGVGRLTNGRYHAYSVDSLFLHSYQAFYSTFNPSENLDCWAANITKSPNGF